MPDFDHSIAQARTIESCAPRGRTISTVHQCPFPRRTRASPQFMPPLCDHCPMNDAQRTASQIRSSTKPPALILASGSPRRRNLLGRLGLDFDVIISDEPETLATDLAPAEQATALAKRKATAVAGAVDRGLVLGADTIVVLDGKILGKPRDDEDAVRMLRGLSGRDHEVITGLALVDAASSSGQRQTVQTVVKVHPLSEDTIAAYVATGEPRDKAGAYAIQGIGSSLIEGFDGCYNNVVGLPLCAVASMLAASGVAAPPSFRGCRLPDGRPCPETSPLGWSHR